MRDLVEALGGRVIFVALQIEAQEQERRLGDPGRASFGKMVSIELLRGLKDDFARCMASMPKPELAIDTTAVTPGAAAQQIAGRLSVEFR